MTNRNSPSGPPITIPIAFSTTDTDDAGLTVYAIPHAGASGSYSAGRSACHGITEARKFLSLAIGLSSSAAGTGTLSFSVVRWAYADWSLDNGSPAEVVAGPFAYDTAQSALAEFDAAFLAAPGDRIAIKIDIPDPYTPPNSEDWIISLG